MRLLTLSQLRHHARHRLQTLLAILGVALGVAVISAVDIIHHSTKQDLRQAQQQINGLASHRIVGATHFINEALYAELRHGLLSRYPRVTLIPILKQSMRASDKTQKTWLFLGIDPLNNSAFANSNSSITTNNSSDLIIRHNAALISTALAVQKGVDIGDNITLSLFDRDLTVFVAGTFGNRTDTTNQQLIVMDIGNVQALFHRKGQLSSIDLYIPNEQQFLIETIAHLLPSNARLLGTEQLVQGQVSLINALEFNLSALGFLSLVIGAFLIFSTVRFSLLQRTPDFSRLRIQGTTHRELQQLLLKEALLLAVVGIGLGWVLGHLLSLSLAPISHRTVTNLYSIHTSSQLVFYWPNYVKAALLGTLTTLISYFLCYRNSQQQALSYSITRIRQEVANKKSHRRQLIAAGLLSSVALMILHTSKTLANTDGNQALYMSYLAACLLTVGALLLIPALLHMCYPILQKALAALFGPIGLIALRDCQRESSRVALAIMALCLAVAVTNGIAMMIDSFRHSVEQWIDTQLNADIYLRSESAYTQSSIDLQQIIRQLHNNTSVKCLSPSLHTTTLLDNKWLPINSVDLSGCASTSVSLLNADSSSAISQFSAGQIFISEPLARKKHLSVDDTLTLHTEQGSKAFHIAGIFRDYGAEHGRVIIDSKHYQRLWNDNTISSVGIYLQDQSLKPPMLKHLQHQIQNVPSLRLIESTTIRSIVLKIFTQTFATTEVLRIIVLLIAVVAIVSTLMTYQLQRAPQLLTLRALGMTVTELRQLFVIQACFIGTSAGILAIPLGLIVAWLLITVINPVAFGWTLVFRSDPMISIFGVIVALTAGLLAAAYPCLHYNKTISLTGISRE